MTQDVVAVGAASAGEGIIKICIGRRLVFVLDGGGFVCDVIQNAAGFAKGSLGVGQRRFLYASVALDNLLGGVGIELLGILQILRCAVLLVELCRNQRCRGLCAGIRAASLIGIPRQPKSACLLILFGALDDVVIEHLPCDGRVGVQACCLADVQEGERDPAHIVCVGILEHLVVGSDVGRRRVAGRGSGIVVGLVLVPELDVVEVLVGEVCVDAFMALVVIDDDVDGVCLRPIGVEGIRLIAVVEDPFALYHEGLDEGVGR